MKKQGKVKKVVLCILALILIYVIGTAISIVKYSEIDEKQPADVCIVLGAATSNGEVSPVYRERLNHGIWLFENGYVDCLIVTGGIGEGSSVSDAYVAKQYAISKGVPENCIWIEEKSTITEENLEQAKLIMDENAWETALLVSDPLHMKRAMLMAEDYGIHAYSSPTPSSMYQSWKTKLPFLAREEFFYIGYCVLRPFR